MMIYNGIPGELPRCSLLPFPKMVSDPSCFKQLRGGFA